MLPEEERLLAAIRAATDEDAPRLVYADWLLERGDPLGEFITLACADGRGELEDDAKSRIPALLREHEAEWLGEIQRVAECQWDRGLPHRATLATRKELRRAIGDPAWRRVQRLDVLGRIDERDRIEEAAALIGHPVLCDLHELVVVDEVLSELLAGDLLPDVERLLVFAGPRPAQDRVAKPFDSGKALVDGLSSRRRIRRLYVNVPTRPADFASLQRPELVLGVGHALHALGEWHGALEGAGAILEKVILTGRRGFSRVKNDTSLEATLCRDELGRWSILEILCGQREDPSPPELLAGLASVPEDAFTRISASGPLNHADAWLADLVRLAIRQRKASLGGVLARFTP